MRTSFDPLGWLLRAACTLFLLTLLLQWSIGVLRTAWPWLVGIAAIIATGALSAALWRRARDRW